MEENEDRLRNSKYIKNIEEFESGEVTYTIGIDGTFRGVKSYCLVRTIIGGSSTILLTKSSINIDELHSIDTEFETEVKNLAKYFDAKIIGDWK